MKAWNGCEERSVGSISRSSFRSCPAQKVPPAPVTSTAATAGCVSASRRIRSRSAKASLVRALRASGRSSVTMRTPESSCVRMGIALNDSGWLLSLSAVAVGRRGHVQGRVLVEETEGLEGEADILDGHDRPVLGPGHVIHAEGVPDDHVGVLEGA